MKKAVYIIISVIFITSIAGCKPKESNESNAPAGLQGSTQTVSNTESKDSNGNAEKIIKIKGIEYNLNANLSKDSISTLNSEELNLLRNAYYAKYGYSFKKAKMKDFFSKYGWYIPKSNDVEKSLTKQDGQNIDLILKAIDNLQKANTVPKDFLSFMSLTKSEILNKLGKSYEIVPAGAEGLEEGYYYKALGLTFTFDESSNNVSEILCEDTVSINGAKAGMNFKQIQEKLGKTQVKDTWVEVPENKAYEIVYSIDNCMVKFLSFSKDGSKSVLHIRK